MAYAVPEADGEVLESPPFPEWADLVRRNRDAASQWHFPVGGLSAQEMRAIARRDLLEVGRTFSARLGVPVVEDCDPEEPIIATGHQPEIFHPGVWVKGFLLERLARLIGACPVDVVVDTDAFEAVSVASPCMQPAVVRCTHHLAVGSAQTCFGLSAPPSREEIDAFSAAVGAGLATLPQPEIGHNFARFCDLLPEASDDADNLAEAVTFARRRYEAAAGNRYLEAPLIRIARTEAFARFVIEMATDSERFVGVYNAELGAYRTRNAVRSAAQPVPDLSAEGNRTELPLWRIDEHRRETVWVEMDASGRTRLVAGDSVIADLPDDTASAANALLESGELIAPKALALTLFIRMFCCDLFIHGIGGARYDEVTDGVIVGYFGVEPPAAAVATMTLHLPLGLDLASDRELSDAKERLNRLTHNPDAFLGEVEFASSEERFSAARLADEKRSLVQAISDPSADKKALGIRIRQVNSELQTAVAPLEKSMEETVSRLEQASAESKILADRTYPFCFWDPAKFARLIQ